MTPVEKALWFIESQFARDVSLDEVAEIGGVSRFYMCRAFTTATGQSVMRYVRGRRLTEAARRMAAGAPDILAVALEAGYGSHEAFTRAFGDQFGLTPEQLRAQGNLKDLPLVEPIRMDQSLVANLEEPRFEAARPLLVAGIGERYTCETNEAIPGQWQRFGPYVGNVPGQVGSTSYGVCCNTDDAGNFDYICGVEVSSFSDIPAELSRVRVPARKYVVFSHRDHISGIRATHYTIWTKWIPQSGLEVADAPSFERYGKDFDPQTGLGGVEIWIPVKE